ncbi:MAG: glycosyltransferase [Oculatellaceae cyanobacterium Prado106]|jgi:glycosyltransferase involved in cell wall biosynthesis|nr:glycosyltransferase [Oculatellaceae cyanobacterium Prado106]
MQVSSKISSISLKQSSLKKPGQDSAIAPPPHAPSLFIFIEIFAREGGIQSYVKDIFRSLLDTEQPTQADVFLLRDQPNCENLYATPNLRFRYFKRRSPQLDRLWMAIALLLYLLQVRPPRVFCGHINLAPLVWCFCRPLRIPYTVMTHGKEVWEPLPWLSRKALQQADQIWTVSRYSRDRAARSNQLNPDKIRLMPCAVDGDRFTPGEKSAELIRRYNLEGSTVLMTVARLWSGDIYKGVDVTIRALPTIAQAIPTVKYLVIGRGDDQPRLAQLAEDMGVGDRVVFAGFVPTEDLPDHYRLADGYVMPSQEGFGIVYLEAMACGVPVISGDADGSADPLQNGALGWQVPHRDAIAVAQACIELLQAQQADPASELRVQGAWLRAQTLEKFSKVAFAQRLQESITSAK